MPDVCSQGAAQKEERGAASRKRKGRVKQKVKKKSSLQSESTVVAEDEGGKGAAGRNSAGAAPGLLHSNKVAQGKPTALETPPPPTGQRAKRKNKILKNKIKSEETLPPQANENPSSTFDLYRRAMMALKMQKGTPKAPSIVSS
nr:PREDICTED: uncharacterized protein LOC100560400 isoform X2 [Anolis carolinensis]|eukprot:XP_016852706.1 PREDICTED: uncharacterized protein LOC100560400 isoform X2 [Anolis carolinensis]